VNEHQASRSARLISAGAWLIALSLVALAIYLGYRFRVATAAAPLPEEAALLQAPAQATETEGDGVQPSLPEMKTVEELTSISRRTFLHTIIPNRPRQDARDYVVSAGDSVFEIATKFNIKPETLLWANYDTLNDNPDLLSLGMELKIPPVDGVFYEWQDGDTLESVAARFEAKIEDILTWPGNGLDLVDPKVEPGAFVMVPGGHREFRQWIIPTIPRGRAGVSVALYGAGACEGGYDGAFGSGAFVWPAGNHLLSGNDYWSGHLGIDVGAGEGAPIYAADSGVVVFAGWANGGYGNMVMIDHGNGYQTLYGHMSSVSVSCGRSVGQGGIIGYSGSTGNSTGAHLHFEVRYMGGFVSPWFVLPAP
jgi:murein DD-endopeptidase MepM/ murein hydrolase activator NlpD